MCIILGDLSDFYPFKKKKRSSNSFKNYLSLVATHRLGSCDSQALGTGASVVGEHGLSCSVACEIFPGQGSKLCPLQADSYHCPTREVQFLSSFVFFCILQNVWNHCALRLESGEKGIIVTFKFKHRN